MASNSDESLNNLMEALGDSYQKLADTDTNHHIVVAYGLKNPDQKNVEDEMIKHEIGLYAQHFDYIIYPIPH